MAGDECPPSLVCHTPDGYLMLVEALEVLADYSTAAWDGCRQRNEGEADDDPQ